MRGAGEPDGQTVTADTVRVLLVDDEADLADVVALHLEQRRDSFAVTTATGGQAALSAFEATEIDCVVSDYEMPGMDGLALLREIHQRDESVPFILYTGRGSEEIASEGISAGVTDYLQKRATSDQYDVLANRIENAVARHRSERARQETELRYRNLVEASPHAIFVHRGPNILYANDSVVDLLDIDDRTEIYGTDPLSYVHPEDRDRIERRMHQALDERESAGWAAWQLRRGDRDIRHVESRGTPISYDGQPAVQVVLRDVTDQRRREQRLEALNDATRQLLTADTPEVIARVAVDTVETVFDESLAAVWTYRPEADRLTALAVTEAATERASDATDGTGTTNPTQGDLEMQVFEAGEPRLVEDYADHDDAMTTAFETVFLLPLDDHGLLSVAALEPDAFSDADRDLLGILARSVVAAFDRLSP
ncbi:response regulator [Halomicroarcula sp. GCM10025709]|uniref:response regulator n=1 Tax=Haloarcula TaxID=2237 RepID=UPI0024C29B09|nr:response regulator [Halomicroarcula sp. YJ-61-S]